ncbi:hypothetical protein [Bradyrhizobium zhanjiangense]|uniref:Uncharacterized protein n=1 Tax=Bradyrhizobium zhanjiangense TaxID=1325107 RepID=A0A4Q0SLJ2_9BRAD|nr:hypothetical protein [Bradyrhizobium zhanjiangense]RXH40417.1 hypothetical protein XH94_13175 [Bradyrhizobium zhanjiangense]
MYKRPQDAFLAQLIGENNRLQEKFMAMNGTTSNVDVAGAGNMQAPAINVEAVGRPTMLSLLSERVWLNPMRGKPPNVFQHTSCAVDLFDSELKPVRFTYLPTPLPWTA